MNKLRTVRADFGCLQRDIEEARELLESIDLYTQGNPILAAIGHLTRALRVIRIMNERIENEQATIE